MQLLKSKLLESLKAILPISIIILVISLMMGVTMDLIINFIVGGLFLMLGLTLFSIGAVASMVALAEHIGEYIVKRRSLIIFIGVAFLVGFMITVAEPALWVLANQFNAVVKEPVLILTVAFGVGLFIVLALLRILFQIKLRTILFISYSALFIFASIVLFVNPGFIPIAFDSGGVTTGPMAVPFIISLGYGISRARGDRDAEIDSFGLVGIASIGPIMAVLLLAFVIEPQTPLMDMPSPFLTVLWMNMVQMGIAILPFILFFAIFQLFMVKLKKRSALKILIGMGYTYIGLVLFLTGANFGLIGLGNVLGSKIALSNYLWLLVPIGMIFGFAVVLAEPSVVALTRQVEEVSAGAISKTFILGSLAIGVSVAIGLSLLRVLTGISIWWFILPGYVIALILTFLSPRIFTAIAFDSGGAVSGAMTSAFLMPFALGAAQALGANLLQDAFGLVALVAMTPLITIQLLGIVFKDQTIERKIDDDDTSIMDLKSKQ